MIEAIAKLLDPNAITGLTTRPIQELREIRTECAAVERDVSLVRRLAQGRLDIVGHEFRRRSGSDSTTDVADLLFDLPDLMADESTGGGIPGARQIDVSAPGDAATELISYLNAQASPAVLSGIQDVDEADLRELFEKIRAYEVEMSGTRRQLHERIDSVQSEIARRYRDGEASVDSLLS